MKETKLPMEDRLLPDTRLELLKDTLRYRFLDVVLLSILTGLFFLPLILWIVVATSLGLLDSSSIASVLLTYGIAILGFMIAGFGLGGTFYVCKKMAWGEGGMLGADFLEGTVKNMGTSLEFYISPSRRNPHGCLWMKPCLMRRRYVFLVFLMAYFFYAYAPRYFIWPNLPFTRIDSSRFAGIASNSSWGKF